MPLTLPLASSVTIARGTDTESRTVIVRAVGNEDLEGIGECAPIPRYHETVESVLDFYAKSFSLPFDARSLDDALENIPLAARCGLDIALHDLLGKKLRAPLWEILGLDPNRIPATCFTIFINDLSKMVERAKQCRHAPILKVKLGLGNEIETIEAIRSVYTGAIRIDANEGWTPEESVKLLREMERFDIELCEQPIPAHNVAQLSWISSRTRIPIVADEDIVTVADILSLAGSVDGVNIKLAKCGGIRAALEMIHVARAMRLRIMLGCMIESSVLITAAAHVAPLVDWVDLDGNLHLARDPYVGVLHETGRLTLPDAPGVGIAESTSHLSTA